MSKSLINPLMRFTGILCLLLSSAFTDAAIYIGTKSSSMIMDISPDGKLKLLYYGYRLENATSLQNNSLIKADDVYSALGTGWVQAAIEAVHSDGNLSTVLQYVSSSQTKKTDNVSETIIILKDAFYPFWVELHYESYYHEDIIKTWVEIHHTEEGEVKLNKYSTSALSMTNQANDYYLTYFPSTWGGEMSVIEEKLNIGQKVIQTVGGIRSSFQHTPDFLGEGFNPSFIISYDHPGRENSGEAIGGALAWSGAWKFDFRLSAGNRFSITTGVNNIAGARYLAPDQVLTTPAMIYSYSNSGKGQISRNFHRWAINYGIRDGKSERSILLNSWEGVYFNQEEKILVRMMDGVKEIGGEMFVIDDGWFGTKYKRILDNAGLGDWVTDKQKIPNGLQYLAGEAKKRGLKFGIWVEPEMVNEKSILFETHPEWIIGTLHRQNKQVRNQYCLDLSNPDVRNYIFESLDRIIKETPGLAYIKWDANRDITDLGSGYLSPEHQSHLWKDYIDGLYSIMDRLATAHPSIVIQACSSGGGRVDYGVLKYCHEFWTSDNTDALQRIYTQWGTSFFYPAEAMAAHVTVVPNHQTGRSTPLKFRFDVAMSGRLGFELQPQDLTPEEMSFAKKAVETYKSIRPVIQQGDLYRLLSPYNNNFSSLMYCDENKKKAVAFVYHLDNHLNEVCPRIRFDGLDERKMYKVTEINSNPGNLKGAPQEFYPSDHLNLTDNVISGQVLKNWGLQPVLKGEYDSVCILFEEVVIKQ